MSSLTFDGDICQPCAVRAPMFCLLQKGIEKAKDYVVAELKKNAIPIRGTEDVKHIAAISAGNDDEIGSMIAEAVDLVGGDGVLTIEDSSSTQTWIDIREVWAIG